MTTKFSNYPVREFDAAEFLTDEESIAAYLTLSFESGDQDELIEALNTVARARGMTQLAKDTGVARESLYKTLSGESKPRFETIAKIADALGLSITFTPKALHI